MNTVNIEVLKVYWQFVASDHSINGLYEINVNGEISRVFRNGDSWGVLSHWFNEPVTKCINFMRADRIEKVEAAIEEYMNS